MYLRMQIRALTDSPQVFGFRNIHIKPAIYYRKKTIEYYVLIVGDS